MKITLRKAAALQTALQELIRVIAFKTTVSISEFAKPGEVIQQGQADFEEALNRKLEATRVLYHIRSLVCSANAASGIDQLLTSVAQSQAVIGLLESFQNQTVEPMLEASEINGRLEKIRNRPADSRSALYGVTDTVTTSVLAQSRLSSLRQQLMDEKKKKQGLQDQILELNIRTTVELDETAVEFLKYEALI